MVYRRLIFAALGGWLTVSAYAQPVSQSTEDSIRWFTDSVLSLVEDHSLYADKIDWSIYRAEFIEEVLSESRFVDALPHFVALWRALDDTHSGIKHADQWYGIPASLDTNGMNDQLKQAYRDRKSASVQTAVLLGKYGYISVPSISTVDDSLATLGAAQALQDSLCKILQSGVTGFIVDLRRNLGGNMYAMLAGIHQLAGPGEFSYLLNQQDSIVSSWGIDDSSVHEGSAPQIILPNGCTLANQIKIAVLVGPLTASSGEITALAFLGKANTVIIGEPSAGYMTGNEVYRLPFGAYLALAEVYETDRWQKKVTRIQPDRLVKGGDNFYDLPNDHKVQTALMWLKE